MTIFGTAGDDPSIQGTAGNDVIDLLAGNDTGRGLGGNDSIFGNDGNDSLIGDDGADTLNGGSGNDTQFAGTGNDLLIAGPGGQDFLIGEAGNDTLDGAASSFANAQWTTSPVGISLNAAAGTAQDGFGSTDSFSGIDRFTGSSFADSMVGGAGLAAPVIFNGADGNDTMVGAPGGTYGLVQVSYSAAASPVVVDLAAGTAQRGAEVDTLVDIHAVAGTNFADTLLGSEGDDFFSPQFGDDSIDGRGGDNDLVSFSFLGASSGVTVTGGDGPSPVAAPGAPPPQADGRLEDFAATYFAFGNPSTVSVIGAEGFDLTNGNDSVNLSFHTDDPEEAFQVLSYLLRDGNDVVNVDGASFDIFADAGIKNIATGIGDDSFTLGGDPTLSGFYDITSGAGDDIFNTIGTFLPAGEYDGGSGFDIFNATWSDGTPVTLADVGFALSAIAGNDPDLQAIISNIEQINLNDADWQVNLATLLNDFTIAAGSGDLNGALGSGNDRLITGALLPEGTFAFGGGFNTVDYTALEGGGTFRTGIDALLLEVSQLPGSSPEEREALYRQAQEILLNDQPWTFLLDGYAGGANWDLGAADYSGTFGLGDDHVNWNLGTWSLDGGGGTNTINYSDSPHSIFADVRVRQAIAEAFNQDLFTHDLTNFQRIVGSPLPDTWQGDSGPIDLELARQLLEEAGFFDDATTVDGGGGGDIYSGLVVADFGGSGDPVIIQVGQAPGTFTAVDGFGATDTLDNVLGIIAPPLNGNVLDFGGTNVFVDITGGIGSVAMGPGGVLGFRGFDAPVVVDLSLGTAAFDGGSYTLNGVVNVVLGTAGDLFIGNGTGNVILPGPGDDFVDGGGGGDSVNVGYIPARLWWDIPDEGFTGGTGFRSPTGFEVDTFQNVEFVVVDGDLVPTDLLVRPSPANPIVGTAFDDFVLIDINFNPQGGNFAPPPPSAQSDLPPGLVDVLEPGDDEITCGDGDDTVFAASGDDIVRGGAGRDFLVGEDDNDSMRGGTEDDVLFGGAGDDFLVGEEGNDFLFSGAGEDVLHSGPGNDRLHVNADDLAAIAGEGFFDVLVPQDNAGGVTRIDLGDDENQNATGTGPVIRGVEAVDASIATAGVSVTGATFTVDFGSGPLTVGNVLFGSLFDDTLEGSAGADIILGNAGADVIATGAGNDTIAADSGNDTITAGSGADNIGYIAGAVVITDFETSGDVLQFFGTATITTAAQARAAVQQVGNDAVLPFGAGQSVTFAGVNPATFTDANFIVF